MSIEFTDDDLKRLKECLKGNLYQDSHNDLSALLTRLEAAENALNSDPHDMNPAYSDRHCKACDAVRVWRTAAGKGHERD